MMYTATDRCESKPIWCCSDRYNTVYMIDLLNENEKVNCVCRDHFDVVVSVVILLCVMKKNGCFLFYVL